MEEKENWKENKIFDKVNEGRPLNMTIISKETGYTRHTVRFYIAKLLTEKKIRYEDLGNQRVYYVID